MDRKNGKRDGGKEGCWASGIPFDGTSRPPGSEHVSLDQREENPGRQRQRPAGTPVSSESEVTSQCFVGQAARPPHRTSGLGLPPRDMGETLPPFGPGEQSTEPKRVVLKLSDLTEFNFLGTRTPFLFLLSPFWDGKVYTIPAHSCILKAHNLFSVRFTAEEKF